MSTYEHSIMLRNQENDKTALPKIPKPQNEAAPTICTPIVTIESQLITSIEDGVLDERPFESFHQLNRTNSSLNEANNNNYMELNSRQLAARVSAQSVMVKKIDENIEESVENGANRDELIVMGDSELDLNGISRIPCIRSDPKNKYSKFGHEKRKSERFNSDSEKQVPIFLPITANVSGTNSNDEDYYDSYVKRSNRRATKTVKLPVNYNDTSPELTARSSSRNADKCEARVSFEKSTGSLSKLSSRSYLETPVDENFADEDGSVRVSSGTYLHNHSDSDESIQIKSMKFEKHKKTKF